MTRKKKCFIIAAACIIAGTWFNQEGADGLEFAASLLSIVGAAAACYQLHREDLNEDTKTPTNK